MSRGPDPVLVLTGPTDATAIVVMEALLARDVPVARCDLSDFPLSLGLTAVLHEAGWAGTLELEGGGKVDVGGIRSIYYRRPTPFRFSKQLSSAELEFAELEARAGLLGVLASLPARWVNHPSCELLASYKPIQLARASEGGLHPPASLITNDPAQAHAFVAARKGRPTLYKSIGHDLAGDPERAPSVAMRLVELGDIDESIRSTAHLFQEFITKAHEVRVTVVGRRTFAVEIHAASDAARLDWRTDYGALTYRLTQIPTSVSKRILTFVEGFGLSSAALDFVVTPAGEWRFLEINPNGQWLWLARQMDLPIAAAVADLLACT